MRATIKLGLTTLLTAVLSSLLLACAPSVTESQPAPLVLEPIPLVSGLELTRPFRAQWQDFGVSLEVSGSFRYSGSEETAFYRVVDRFYTENPGFCPVEKGFLVGLDGKTFVTLAARGLEVRAFAYDLSARPGVTFVFLKGQSSRVLKTQSCRTVGP